MKKIRHILVAYLMLVGAYGMKAQTPPDSSANLKEIIDWTFAPLDTSQYISTGILMDKGMMDSFFFWHRGSINDSTIFNNSWYQLYYSSFNAQVEGNNSLITLDSVYSLVRPYINDGYIPIMGISVDYNFLNPDALDSNWIDTIDGQVFIEPGQNPFMQDSIFAFAPSTHHHTIFSDTLTLIFPEELFLTNKSHTITSIEVKIDDGDWILVNNGILPRLAKWKRVTVLAPSNCVPTDHVPGGLRNDIKKASGPQHIDEKSKLLYIGTIYAHVDQECFVPSISGLDINTTDYFYDINSNLINRNIPYPSIFPFQAYYAPENIENHVFISYDASDPTNPIKSNIAWLVEELKKNHVGLGSSLVSTFNFGEPFKNRLPTVYVNSGATLQVNGNYATGYGTGCQFQVPHWKYLQVIVETI